MTVTLNGIVCRFNLGSGTLGWCSDWANVRDLVGAGYLTSKWYGGGRYGHAEDFFPTDKARAAARRQAETLPPHIAAPTYRKPTEADPALDNVLCRNRETNEESKAREERMRGDWLRLREFGSPLAKDVDA